MPGSRVYIGNMPSGVRERDLERFFKSYGRPSDVLIKQGFGFIEFEDYRDADDAVYELNGKELMGQRVSVEHARGPRRDRSRDRTRSRRDSRAPWLDKYGPPTRTDYRVTVENLSTRVSWQDLKDLMRKAGDVTYANAHKDKRNEGIVEFASKRDMERAMDKFDDYELNGRRIKIVECKSSRGRSRSRSRSRSRRRSSGERSRSGGRRSRDSRSRSKRRSKSRSRSGRSKSRSKSRRSGSKSSRSRSRSGSAKKKNADDRDRSKSKSRSKERSKSRSRSASRDKRSKSRDSQAEKRSRSRSPEDESKRQKVGSESPVANGNGVASRSNSPQPEAVPEENEEN